MPYRYHGRAQVNPQKPAAFAVCDYCGFLYNHNKLQWIYDFNGPVLQNLRFLVCRTCLDKPQEQKKPILLPPDPLPIQNARPMNYDAAETDYRTTSTGDIRIAQNDDPRVIESSQWNSYATTGASGDGTTATITFSGGTIPVGNKITITGVSPAGYNGDYVVTASSAGSVSFLNATTGSQALAGTLIVPVTRNLTNG